jgi:TolB protein
MEKRASRIELLVLVAAVSAALVVAPCALYGRGSVKQESENEITNLIHVTTGTQHDTCPTWMPDGGSVVFCSDRFGGIGICRQNKGGGAIAQVTVAPSPTDAELWPDVNRITKEIVFVSTRAGGPKQPKVGQIFIIAPGGTVLSQVKSFGEGAAYPSWSPDGSQIAYCAPDQSGIWYVWAMRRDGTDVRQITPGIQPRWSPDGGRLVFSKESNTPGRKPDWDIYTINIDGSGIIQITADEGNETLPDWSPDGKWICYVSVRDRKKPPPAIKDVFGELKKGPNSDIWLRSLASTDQPPMQLTRLAGQDTYPRWSPDGREIVFASDRSGDLDIWSTTPVAVGKSQ